MYKQAYRAVIQHTVFLSNLTEAFPDTKVECSHQQFYNDLDAKHNKNAIKIMQS